MALDRNKLSESNYFQSALECYEHAIQIQYDLSTAWYYKGQSLYGLQQYPNALQSFNKALEFDDKNTNAWDAKGLALESLGKGAEAKECFDISRSLRKINLHNR